jgi:hypothetical protein
MDGGKKAAVLLPIIKQQQSRTAAWLFSNIDI